MMSLVLKALATAVFIVIVSVVAKRSTLFAALMIGMPMATMMTVGLTYLDTRDAVLATRLATTTFILVGPGLLFFIALPVLQKMGMSFLSSFGIAVGVTSLAYIALILVLKRFGVEL